MYLDSVPFWDFAERVTNSKQCFEKQLKLEDKDSQKAHVLEKQGDYFYCKNLFE
jgi:hypothetical protein